MGREIRLHRPGLAQGMGLKRFGLNLNRGGFP